MRLILFLTLYLNLYQLKGQEKPIFLGQKTIKGPDDFYPTEVVKWKYKSYTFIESTVMLARPYPNHSICKNGQCIKNSELFNKDMEEWINDKIYIEYVINRKNDPDCYPERLCWVTPIDIEEVGIYIDEKNMYFMYLWSDNHYEMLVLKSERYCDLVYSTLIVKVPLDEINKYIKK